MAAKIHEDPRNEGLTYMGHPVYVDSVFLNGCRVLVPKVHTYKKCGHTFGYIRCKAYNSCGADRVPIMVSRDIRADEVFTLEAIKV